jgi:hypothetical protein
VAGVQVQGTQIGSDGGDVTLPEANLTISVPAEALSGRPAVAQLVTASADAVPPVPGGFALGSTSVQLTLRDPASGEPLINLPVPLTLTWSVNSADLQAAGGDLSRVRWASSDGEIWQALPCSASADSSMLTCTVANASQLSVLISPAPTDPQDWDLPNGHFYEQANGFNGAGGIGYSVTDDADAAFWTEFQRLGGVAQLGYPITGRFQHKGFLTQAFQKLALQWRPDTQQAVPVNVFDDLNERGADAWLDRERQIPPAADTSPDAGLSFDEVMSRHIALLDQYPALADFYQNAPDAVTRYGLPLSVKDYGTFVAVRLQRGTLQLWTIDTPFVQAGSVVAGNGSDVAKEVGLWPPEATAPVPAPNPPPATGQRTPAS